MTKDKAKKIQERMDKLEALNGGRLTPDAVVEDAKDPRSPMHDQFEWDDKVAGHQYRLDQARTLIRAVTVERNTVSRTVAAPYYIRDPRAGNEQGYVSMATLRSDSDIARDAVEQYLNRVVSALESARAVAGELGLTDDLEALLASAVHVKTKAGKKAA